MTITPDQVPEWAVDKYRYRNVDDDWWEYTIDCFVESAPEKYGVEIDKEAGVYFDLGRGRYLECSIAPASGICAHPDGTKEFCHRHLDMSQYPLACLMFEAEANTHWDQYGSQKQLFDFHFNDGIDLIYDMENPWVEAMAEQWQKQLEEEEAAICEGIQDKMQDIMGELLNQLDEEHDYLTSDEYIREMLADDPDIWIDDEENEEEE